MIMDQTYSEKVRGLHERWLEVREEYARRLRRTGDNATAAQVEGCTMFRGDERFGRLCVLFKEPQAVEFCLWTGFPSLADLREFREYGAEDYGIYIDAGDIELRDPGNVMLAGDTRARIFCDSTDLHTITALHGASATVNATGWAVVRPERDRVSHIVTARTGNAIIL